MGLCWMDVLAIALGPGICGTLRNRVEEAKHNIFSYCSFFGLVVLVNLETPIPAFGLRRSCRPPELGSISINSSSNKLKFFQRS